MFDLRACNVCDSPGTFENATEIRQVCSNVREFKEQKFTVWRCSNCRSLHSKEKIDLSYYYSHYPLGKQKLNYFTYGAYRNRLRLLVKHGLKKGHKILDFGCNKGLFLSFLQQLGYQNTFGYDTYVAGYSDKRVFKKKYHIITSQDVIEHVDEPCEFFDQLVDCLEKGGLLAIGTPNADKIDLSKPEAFLMELHQPYHRHILSEEALLKLGLCRGLEVVGLYKRRYNDTFYPGINTRFSWTYAHYAGNVLDVLFEKPRVMLVLTSPLLLFYAFTGNFFPPPGNMTVFFRRVN
jgi:2-polyprenyl-3-methyl-5-hydroxy-6-metoxy-1,4-benzoquinol methylase